MTSVIENFKDFIKRAEQNPTIDKKDISTLYKVLSKFDIKPMNNGRNLYDYPYNILHDANYNITDEFKKLIDAKRFDNIVNKHIKPLYKNVIQLYYKDKMSLTKIAAEEHVSKQAIDQRRYKLAKQLQSANIKALILDYENIEALNKINEDINNLRQQQKEVKKNLLNNISILNDYIRNTNNIIGNNDYKTITQSVENNIIYDPILSLSKKQVLSHRACYCLSRAGFNCLADLEGANYYDIINITNLGKKTVVEVLDVLNMYDIKIKYNE